MTATMAAGAVLVAALWVAICAAAPELIWQGLGIALGHFTRTDLVTALLLGAILAFFVEPIMERFRVLLGHDRYREAAGPRNVLFAACLGLSFAFVSVCVHDAMVAFVSNRQPGSDVGLHAAIALTAAWAIVPAAIGLAWLGAGCGWVRLPLGIIAVASPAIAGWLFAWSAKEVVTTAIPCLLILGLGYLRAASGPRRRVFVRCAPVVAIVAAAWLAAAVLFDVVLGLSGLGRAPLYPLYAPPHFWIDARFYLGWTLGLVLAPSPFRGTADTAAPLS